MADPLYELLTPYFDSLDTPARPLATDPTTVSYLNQLTTLSLSDLTTSETTSLAQSSQSLLRSLQALSKRSHKSIITATSHLSNLSSTLPSLFESSTILQDALPELESSTANFAEKYRKSTEADNEVLLRRKKALLLSQNADRISSILDLPALLSSTISSSQPAGGSGAASGTSGSNYASALDLHAHIKRLTTLYPNSPLVMSINVQAEQEMRLLTTALIGSLQSPGIKLAGAMRTIGWLRRVAPELDEQMQLQRSTTGYGKAFGTSAGATLGSFGSTDGALGALFLVCRLAQLVTILDALEPLRELADQETQARLTTDKPTSTGPQPNRRQSKDQDERFSGGHQTERYLKRYIEIFREQSFAIVSMYRSIFPSALPVPGSEGSQSSLEGLASPSLKSSKEAEDEAHDALLPLPSPLATFPSHLVEMLFETLQRYLPNVRDKAARDSLLTQVLYCASSLGRLGGDFSMMLALLQEDEDEESQDATLEVAEPEWVQIMKKHRIQASRLELLASGVGGVLGRKESIPLRTASSPVNS
jgi:conserved oligomeric Golgi complex subunit 8